MIHEGLHQYNTNGIYRFGFANGGYYLQLICKLNCTSVKVYSVKCKGFRKGSTIPAPTGTIADSYKKILFYVL